MTKQISVEPKFEKGDFVAFRNDDKGIGIAYSFGTIEEVTSLLKRPYSDRFEPVYTINKYGGGVAYKDEHYLKSIDDFCTFILGEKPNKVDSALLDEVAPSPSKNKEGE